MVKWYIRPHKLVYRHRPHQKFEIPEKIQSSKFIALTLYLEIAEISSRSAENLLQDTY